MIEISRSHLPNDLLPLDHFDDNRLFSHTILRSKSFSKLLSVKWFVIAPLLAISFAYVFTVALLAGFAPGVMSLKIVGSFNLGYLLVLGIYLLCWIVSVAYVCAANGSFEALSMDVAKEFAGESL